MWTNLLVILKGDGILLLDNNIRAINGLLVTNRRILLVLGKHFDLSVCRSASNGDGDPDFQVR